jgi:hypothetical protein
MALFSLCEPVAMQAMRDMAVRVARYGSGLVLPMTSANSARREPGGLPRLNPTCEHSAKTYPYKNALQMYLHGPPKLRLSKITMHTLDPNGATR